MKVFAQECIKTLGPFGEICTEGDTGGKGVLENIAKIFSKVIGVVTIVAGLWFLLQFIIAAFTWLTSGGDPQKIAEAQSRIINALIGLTLVVSAVAIMKIVELFFGLTVLDLPGVADKIG